MKLENQVCSLELAKRLKELGVKQESLWVWTLGIVEGYCLGLREIQEPDIGPNDCAAFTVAELWEDMGHGISLRRNVSMTWVASYDFLGKPYGASDDLAVDALAKLKIILLENKLIEVPRKALARPTLWEDMPGPIDEGASS